MHCLFMRVVLEKDCPRQWNSDSKSYRISCFLQLCNVTIAENEAPTRITALKAARKSVYVNAVYIAGSRDRVDDCKRARQIITWKKIKIKTGSIA